MATAVADEIIQANPCRVRGAGTNRRARRVEPATLDELEVLVTEMPAKYRALVLIGSWCGLRFGEMAELRRGTSTSRRSNSTSGAGWCASGER
ncbi:hypothetical protein LP422_24155 [Janibacter limosus]|uniref:hypothetical protein n=1 Tax=Janibacter limosus TaxID=53458 RepID=UPI0035D63D4C|nr:hypothetical protein LP422_24155 [Janibacter limosus]